MEKSINPEHTLYAIFFQLENEKTIQIGKLTTHTFDKGKYIYVGSAKKNIAARVNRHIRLEKPLRWHFDYLRPYGEVTKVITFEEKLGECGLTNQLKKKFNASTPVKKFGSSDCRCYSHLLFYEEDPLDLSSGFSPI